jgi:hypothetical protein
MPIRVWRVRLVPNQSVVKVARAAAVNRTRGNYRVRLARSRSMSSHKNSAIRVGLESRHAPSQLGLLRGRQAHVLERKTVPKLADQVEPFFGAQAGNV